MSGNTGNQTGSSRNGNGSSDAALIVAQQNVGALANPDDMAEAVGEVLNWMAGAGVDNGALAEVQQGVLEMLATAKRLKQEFEAAMKAAQEIQTQREAAQAEFKKLLDDVSSGNTDRNEVERLHEILQDEIYESLWFQDSMWEESTNAIMQGSPLDIDEAAQLWNVLTGGHIDGDSAVWDQLREWMDEAEREQRIASGWPPDFG